MAQCHCAPLIWRAIWPGARKFGFDFDGYSPDILDRESCLGEFIALFPHEFTNTHFDLPRTEVAYTQTGGIA